jgi:hypothetical protein
MILYKMLIPRSITLSINHFKLIIVKFIFKKDNQEFTLLN